jgi:hypothetical protein
MVVRHRTGLFEQFSRHHGSVQCRACLTAVNDQQSLVSAGENRVTNQFGRGLPVGQIPSGKPKTSAVFGAVPAPHQDQRTAISLPSDRREVFVHLDRHGVSQRCSVEGRRQEPLNLAHIGNRMFQIGKARVVPIHPYPDEHVTPRHTTHSPRTYLSSSPPSRPPLRQMWIRHYGNGHETPDRVNLKDARQVANWAEMPR